MNVISAGFRTAGYWGHRRWSRCGPPLPRAAPSLAACLLSAHPFHRNKLAAARPVQPCSLGNQALHESSAIKAKLARVVQTLLTRAVRDCP